MTGLTVRHSFVSNMNLLASSNIICVSCSPTLSRLYLYAHASINEGGGKFVPGKGIRKNEETLLAQG